MSKRAVDLFSLAPFHHDVDPGAQFPSSSPLADTMIQTGIIENAHGDLVTDVAYDFYGLRLATCSLDQRFVVRAPLPKSSPHFPQNQSLAARRDERNLGGRG